MPPHECPSMTLHNLTFRAELSADRAGECLLEITHVAPAASAWQLEVIWQPVDDRGLARGSSCRLFETPLEFSALDDQPSCAYVRLPVNISFELARKCYFRITRRLPSDSK